MDRSGRGAKPNAYRLVLRDQGRGIAAAALSSALINVLMLTGSLYMLQVYDRVLGSGSVPTLLGLFAIVVVLYGFLGFYDFLRSRLLARCAMRLDLQLSPKAFAGWIGGGSEGRAASMRPLRDIETLRGFLSGPAASALFDLPWVPLFLGILFILHPWLGWLTVGGAVVGAILALAMRWLTQRPIAEAATLDAEERDFVEQGRGAAEVIRAMGMTGWVSEAWRRRHLAALAMQQRAGNPAEILGPASRAFRMLLQSAILTLGAYLVLRHELSAGMIIASSILSGRALAPVDQVIGQWRAIGRVIEAHRRLDEAFAGQGGDRPRIELPAPTGRIAVNRLTKFAPGTPGTDRPRILTQVSFELEPGDGLGVIGASASGKSTLARLLVGAWAPDAGEVRFDGATLEQWAPELLGRYVGYLPQQVRMLPGTIAENISRFDPDALDAAVIGAAKLTGIHETILSLPDGYATRLGGASEPLSGGQIQRLGLARAIYRTPKFVVLDEPNSNLDAEGDAALTQAILSVRRRGGVAVVVAHRPSALEGVDMALAMVNGGMAAFGEKEEVLRKVLRPNVVPVKPNPQPASAGPVAAQG
jgi:PrtD family type I secretion system ABC transporter